MLNGFNTEKIKFSYIFILLLTVACVVASYSMFLSYNSRYKTAQNITNLLNSQSALSEKLSALLRSHEDARNRNLSKTASRFIRDIATQLQTNHIELSASENNRAYINSLPEQIRVYHGVTATSLSKAINILAKEVSLVSENKIVSDKSISAAEALSNITQSAIHGHELMASQSLKTIHILQLVSMAGILFLLGIQGSMIFYPTYLELQKNEKKVQKTRKELNYAATHDPITGLLNRRESEKILNWSIANAEEKNKMVGLFHIDIDDFKTINEKMGHTAGDNMLHQAAQRLSRTFRKSDTVARMGGDEFLVIIPNLDCEETLSNLSEKLLDVFQVPFSLIGGQSSQISASIGMACYPDDARNSQELKVAADMALRKSKEKGKKRYTRFNSSMKSDFNKKMAICDRISHALDNKEFEIFYHPQVHIQSGCVTGIEALVRWRDPEFGLRAPGSFIDTVEASGYMIKLGAYILDQAISDAHYWYDNDINFGRIALNMSAVQLNDIDLVNQLLNSLMKHKLPPDCLSIEILENVVMTGQEHRFKQLIDELNDLNIHVELDDFGTGHASLYNLKQFSINRIKLDCDFISEIEHNERQSNIVEGLVKIINNIGLEIIAEGVETTRQAEMLRNWGCHHAQGYLYTEPLPFEEMTAYLKQANYKRTLDSFMNKQDKPELSKPVKQLNSA